MQTVSETYQEGNQTISKEVTRYKTLFSAYLIISIVLAVGSGYYLIVYIMPILGPVSESSQKLPEIIRGVTHFYQVWMYLIPIFLGIGLISFFVAQINKQLKNIHEANLFLNFSNNLLAGLKAYLLVNKDEKDQTEYIKKTIVRLIDFQFQMGYRQPNGLSVSKEESSAKEEGGTKELLSISKEILGALARLSSNKKPS